jgi:hypothetical protein
MGSPGRNLIARNMIMETRIKTTTAWTNRRTKYDNKGLSIHITGYLPSTGTDTRSDFKYHRSYVFQC